MISPPPKLAHRNVLRVVGQLALRMRTRGWGISAVLWAYPMTSPCKEP
jgi:hypothetical protein